MKKVAFLFCMYMLSAAPLHAVDALQELFTKGNNAYKESAYDSALSYYLQIDSAGYTGWELHYNAGNAYFKTGQIAHAVLHYEKALRLSPGNKDVLHNLKFAEQSTVDDITRMPQLFYEKWWQNLLTLFTATTWFVISAVFFIFTCAGVFVYFTNLNGLKLAGYYLTAAGAIFCLFTILITYSAHSRLTAQNEGVIMTSTVKVKSEPSATGKTLFVIHSGLKVLVRTEEEGMAEIQLPDGRVGWIENKELTRI